MAQKIDTGAIANIATIAVLGIVVGKVLGALGDFMADDGGDDSDDLLPEGMDPQDITIPPTISAQQAGWIASAIYTAVYGDGSFWNGNATENEEVVVESLKLAQNDADVLAISKAYGKRSGRFSWSGDLTLLGTVITYLDVSDLAAINDDYASKGINITFAA